MLALNFSIVFITIATVTNAFNCLRPQQIFLRKASSFLGGSKIDILEDDPNLFPAEKDNCNDFNHGVVTQDEKWSSNPFDEKWNSMFMLLKQFQIQKGHCNIPRNHTEDGQNLGLWLNTQRQSHKKGALDAQRKARLQIVGVVWDPSDEKWNAMFALLTQFQEREGQCNVLQKHKEDGQNLGIWLTTQRNLQKKGALDARRKASLEEAGVVWDPFDEKWNSMFVLFRQFQKREGHCRVLHKHKEDGQNLGTWLNTQRNLQKIGTLDARRKSRLEKVGVVW